MTVRVLFHRGGEAGPDRAGGGGLQTTRAYDLNNAHRFKSSRGNGGGGNRVEGAYDFTGVAPVRDGKVTDGPVLIAPAAARTAFAAGVKE
ncbi:DUF397 domain-containing protein [Streptomyces sp. NPDC004284]|uniref:DUF397 domain-containing protein n=1 Tax=Streptomyces sp. NPDC004284 TaxID=3364695 RepID=UPI003675B417